MMDVTEANDKVSELQQYLDVRVTTEKYNLIKNIDKTNALQFKVRS